MFETTTQICMATMLKEKASSKKISQMVVGARTMASFIPMGSPILDPK